MSWRRCAPGCSRLEPRPLDDPDPEPGRRRTRQAAQRARGRPQPQLPGVVDEAGSRDGVLLGAVSGERARDPCPPRLRPRGSSRGARCRSTRRSTGSTPAAARTRPWRATSRAWSGYPLRSFTCNSGCRGTMTQFVNAQDTGIRGHLRVRSVHDLRPAEPGHRRRDPRRSLPLAKAVSRPGRHGAAAPDPPTAGPPRAERTPSAARTRCPRRPPAACRWAARRCWCAAGG